MIYNDLEQSMDGWYVKKVTIQTDARGAIFYCLLLF